MILIICVLGLIIGSFLNVCIYRIPKEESISYPQSHCRCCKKEIKFYDLIPIISYVNLQGKCRNCGSKISIKYPIIEAITSILLCVNFIQYGPTLQFVKYSILIALMIIFGVIDYDTKYVYRVVTSISIIFAFLFMFLEKYFYNISILNYILGGIFTSTIIWIIYIITKGALGAGDIELFLIGGLFLGIKMSILLLLFTFILAGGVVSIFLLFKKVKSKDYIPLGPFISITTILLIIFKNTILTLYF